ncbi:MAG TPA: Fic family protein [Fimbriimonadaceae bacterium]|nr:Fic family protein [Fimbriimonadaceae bacterium]
MSRYQLPEGDDGEFEPGSGRRVLKNHLHIANSHKIEELETLAYESAIRDSILHLDSKQGFTRDFIRDLHRNWLGGIYPFAGELRVVNVSKGFVTFCPAANLPAQFQAFEDDILSRYTPCDSRRGMDLAYALAVVHVEFILVHPFREGNGRLGRWLATLMALQAGHPFLDFSLETTEVGRKRYFAALRRGFLRDLAPAVNLFGEILKRSS